MKDADPTLVADYRPACTVWKKTALERPSVFVVQAEGGYMEEADMREATELLLSEMGRCGPFSTLYDLTGGVQNLMSCAPGLIDFGRRQRLLYSDRQVCTVVVCPDEQVRNWVRWIMTILPSTSVPVHIAKDIDDAWTLTADFAAAADPYGEDFRTPLSVNILDPI
jgi:hypothetical protein